MDNSKLDFIKISIVLMLIAQSSELVWVFILTAIVLQHGKNGIFCVAWSHKDSKRIATCSGDGFW